MRLASASWDGIVLVTDTVSGEVVLEMQGHEGMVNSVDVSKDGTRLVSGGQDGTVRVWATSTGKELAVLKTNFMDSKTDGESLMVNSLCSKISMPVTCVAFSPTDHERVISRSTDKCIRLWNSATGECQGQVSLHSFDASESSATTPSSTSSGLVAWNQAGTKIASGSDRVIKIWSVGCGGSLDYLSTLLGHNNRVFCVSFSPTDPNLLVSGSLDKSIKSWNISTCQCLSSMTGHSFDVLCMTWNKAGTKVASGSSDKTIKIWDIATGTCELTMSGHKGNILSVSFDPQGNTLASGGLDNSIRLWSVKAGASNGSPLMTEHKGGVRCEEWNKQATKVASGGDDKTVKIWNTLTGICELTMRGHSHSVRCLSWNQQGSKIASGSYDASVKVWDTTTGSCELTMMGHSGSVTHVEFSSDDRSLISGSIGNDKYNYDSTTRVWEVASGVQTVLKDTGSFTFSEGCSETQIVGDFVITVDEYSDLVRVHQTTATSATTATSQTTATSATSATSATATTSTPTSIAMFRAPGSVWKMHCVQDRIAVGCYNGKVKILNPKPFSFTRYRHCYATNFREFLQVLFLRAPFLSPFLVSLHDNTIK